MEWKVCNEIVMYASHRSSDLFLSENRDYTTKKDSDWDKINL